MYVVIYNNYDKSNDYMMKTKKRNVKGLLG